MSFIRKISKLFRHKKKSFVLDQKYKVAEAFTFNGVTYYQFDDSFQIPTGRAFAALTFYHELEMKCDKRYLEMHCKAMEILLSDPKKININAIAIINKNLKERLNLAPFPDHIYKLASVMFFDDSESPYNYDYKYGQKKIEGWKQGGSMLDFFLKIPLKDLIPSLSMPEKSLETYFPVLEEINRMHHSDLSEVLSKEQ
jgi:hypothetical protein